MQDGGCGAGGNEGVSRVDSGDEDALIAGLIETGERMLDINRMEAGELEGYLSI